MPNHVLQLDCTAGNGDVEVDFGSGQPEIWVEFDVALNTTFLSSLVGQMAFWLGHNAYGFIGLYSGVLKWRCGAATPFTPASPITALQFYHVKLHLDGAFASGPLTEMWIDGTLIGTDSATLIYNDTRFFDLEEGVSEPGGFLYFDNFKAGTTDGGVDLGTDDFEGGSLAFWNGGVADAAIIADPGIAPPAGGPVPLVGRVLIAFDDGPLVPSPTWTAIDQGGAFPDQFVSGYDLTTGRQTLLAQTDTGTATVYINDHEQGLFDPRNVSSPYFGKLDGRQILLQLYDPVRAVWESQFQGHIDEVTYDIDGSAVDANGDPINASIQINCVDIFDYLAGYGLTPGLNGVMPTPVGGEDGVWYAETVSFVDDRILEILTDVGIDPTRYVVFSGNVRAQEVKYDPDESAMVALRDASDAEFPFIANMYVDRFGRYCWHGRYGRFDPAAVSTDAGVDRWDWHDWNLGDGKAILADATRTQIRVLSYVQARNQIVNVAVCYPQGMKPAQMPSQVFTDTSSITAYGKFSAPPMSELLVKEYIGPGAPVNANAECLKYAELLVKNQKDPRVSISAIQLKTVDPGDARATNVWACLTQCDISDVVNVKVGYPSGTGLGGDSPEDDYFVEGRQMRVRPLQPGFDYVELDLNVSPFVWSADTHSVFPARGDSSAAPGLVADFSAA